MSDEVDPELLELLGSAPKANLDESVLDEPKPEKKQKVKAEPKLMPIPVIETPPAVEDDDIDESVEEAAPITPPVVEPVLEKPNQNEIQVLPPSTLTEEPKKDDSEGIKAAIRRFSTITDGIISNYEKDRAEADEAIQYFKGVVKDAGDNRRGIAPYVEGWSKALSIKAEINCNATSILDSFAKMLAAGKGNDLIINVGDVKQGDLDLEKLLSQNKKEDEK